METEDEPRILREELPDGELLHAILEVRDFMYTSPELDQCCSYFRAEKNPQNRDILHVTSTVLQRETNSIENLEQKEESEACSARWNSLWKTSTKFATGAASHGLREYYQELFPSQAQAKCLVPLCGVSLDLLRLAEAGHVVVGVEISEVAVKKLLNDYSLRYSCGASEAREFVSYSVEGEFRGQLSFLQGDIFDYLDMHLRKNVDSFDAVLDSRSLPAVVPSRRAEYVRLMENVVKESGRILLEVVEHELEMSKPPYSLSHDQVLALYANSFDVSLLNSYSRCGMTERVYLLVRKATGIPKTHLPESIQPCVRRVFTGLQAVARRHLENIGLELNMNTLRLNQSGDLDVLRFLRYKGGGRVLKEHVDPGLLTIHIALEGDVCVHTSEEKSDGGEETADASYLTVFSSDQLGVVSRGKIKPSAHHADAERARFAVTFNCYVDSNMLVAPMDNVCSPKNSLCTESGLDYVERIFGKLEVALPVSQPVEGPSFPLSLTIEDVRSHWSLLRSLFAEKAVYGEVECLKQTYLAFLANIQTESVEKGELVAPPTPPSCIRLCWVAHMLQPSTYKRDCLNAFNAVLPHSNSKESRMDATSEFKKWWKLHAGKEFPESKKSDLPHVKMNWDFLMSAEELYDRLVTIGTSFQHDDGKAAHLLNDYKRYIIAAEKNKDSNLAPGPLIDIVWHAHQTNPVAYNLDMSERAIYLDHLPRSAGEDVKPWLRNTVKAWKELFPHSKPPVSSSIQAGCGCCQFDQEAQEQMQREQEEAARRAAEQKRLKEEKEIRLYELNESFDRIAQSSRAFPWSHAKVMQVSTGNCSFSIMDVHESGSVEAQTLETLEPVNVQYAVSSEGKWQTIQTPREILRQIGHRVVDENARSKSGVKIEQTQEFRFKCARCEAVNVMKKGDFRDYCTACNHAIPHRLHENLMLIKPKPQTPENRLSYSVWDLCALSSSLGTTADVFLTQHGLTLIVFNLDQLIAADRRSRRDADGIELTETYKLRAWLKAVHFYEDTADVILVGMHSKKLQSGSLDRARTVLNNLLKEFPTLNVIKNTTHGLAFFATQSEKTTQQMIGVSNAPPNTKKLRNLIDHAVSQQMMCTKPRKFVLVITLATLLNKARMDSSSLAMGQVFKSDAGD